MKSKSLSPRKLASIQANTAKSTGPRTPAGKARSSMNALKHGLRAATVCIPGESLPAWEKKRAAYYEFFQPGSEVETDLVDDLLATRWRKQRLIGHQSAIIHVEMDRRQSANQQQFQHITPDVEAALAVKELADTSPALHLLVRYESQLTYSFNSAWKHLGDVRSFRPPIPNELNPISGHGEETAIPAASAGPSGPAQIGFARNSTQKRGL